MYMFYDYLFVLCIVLLIQPFGFKNQINDDDDDDDDDDDGRNRWQSTRPQLNTLGFRLGSVLVLALGQELGLGLGLLLRVKARVWLVLRMSWLGGDLTWGPVD